MNLNDIEHNIKLCHSVFKSLIIDNNSKRTSEHVISWDNYISGINSDLYVKDFENMVDNRQFSFLLKDSSIVQIYYQTDDEKFIKYKLAYYPTPVVKKLTSDEIEDYFDEATNDLYLSYYSQLIDTFGEEIVYTNSNHVRFDYDSKVESHFKNHIQFGGINDLRIPVKFFIVPFCFIDFIIRNIYPSEFERIKEKSSYKALRALSSKYVELETFTEYDSLYVHKDF